MGEPSASSPEAVKGDRVGGGVGDDLLLGRALLGEGHDRVQAGGDTGQPECRRVLGNGGAQPVAPAAVAQPAAPQVPVEGPGGQQVGQYELVQNWVVAVAPTIAATVPTLVRGTLTATVTTADDVTPAPLLALRCRVDTRDWAACGPTYTATGLSTGGHTFTAQAIDQSGNVGTWTATFRSDVTSPAVPTFTAPTATTYLTSPVTYSYRSTDVGSTVATMTCGTARRPRHPGSHRPTPLPRVGRGARPLPYPSRSLPGRRRACRRAPGTRLAMCRRGARIGAPARR